MGKKLYNIVYDILLNHKKKEQNLAICNNMDGCGEHCARWNKSDREGQILYSCIYTCNLKTKQK